MSLKTLQGKCSVCGKYGNVTVCCSACGAQTLAYCDDCLLSGAEPWGELVFYISCAGNYPEDINDTYKEIVKATCERLGKTEEEFAEAVRKENLDDYGFNYGAEQDSIFDLSGCFSQ